VPPARSAPSPHPLYRACQAVIYDLAPLSFFRRIKHFSTARLSRPRRRRYVSMRAEHALSCREKVF
jgi:hypothetical protein